MLKLFQPTETRGKKNKEVGLSVFTLQKFPIVSKNKKTTQKLFE